MPDQLKGSNEQLTAAIKDLNEKCNCVITPKPVAPKQPLCKDKNCRQQREAGVRAAVLKAHQSADEAAAAAKAPSVFQQSLVKALGELSFGAAEWAALGRSNPTYLPCKTTVVNLDSLAGAADALSKNLAAKGAHPDQNPSGEDLQSIQLRQKNMDTNQQTLLWESCPDEPALKTTTEADKAQAKFKAVDSVIAHDADKLSKAVTSWIEEENARAGLLSALQTSGVSLDAALSSGLSSNALTKAQADLSSAWAKRDTYSTATTALNKGVELASIPLPPLVFEEVVSFEGNFPTYDSAWVRDNQKWYELVVGGEKLKAGSSAGNYQAINLLTCQANVKVELYRAPTSCREYLSERPVASISIPFPTRYNPYGVCSSDNFKQLDNGITVGNPKIYDTFGLKKLLAVTAAQFASVNPVSAAAITNAYGTLQGIQRDTSYLSVQVTTAAAPNVVTTANGATNTTTTNTPLTTVQGFSCPAGFIPQSSTTSSGTVTISCVAGSSSGNTLLNITSGPSTTTPSSTSVVAADPTKNTVTTQNGVAGSIPVAPASTALAAPTATSVSSADMLAEQVQLSSQLTMLQMLLQGADSDKLLVADGRALAMRKQTTLSFPITLRPPAAFKHAAAEVRVLVIPRRAPLQPGTRMDVVNLLPSEKTYNVAKITSKQRSFGAGVVIEAVNVGVNTGRSKDRLYIAKDTDTVALQFPTQKIDTILSSWPHRIAPAIHNTFVNGAGKWDSEDDCTVLLPPELTEPTVNGPKLKAVLWDFSAATMFGWQFRPVLGADYVASNVRNVFAQLALPKDQNSDDDPALDVFVQTRWRKYDSSAQVTGPSYASTCQWTHLDNSIVINNKLKVKDLQIDDAGGGILRFRADGDLLSSSFTVRSGPSLIPPQFFNGNRIEFFANASDVLHNGDLQLVAEDGEEIPLRIPTRDDSGCEIKEARIDAIPRPDGTAVVVAQVKRGEKYKFSSDTAQAADGEPHYKILVGSTVYGLLETPFLNASSQIVDGKRSYQFEAQTSDLRSGRNFLLRDIAWDSFGRNGTIRFSPTFSSAASLPDNAEPNASASSSSPKTKVTWYEVKGADFRQISDLEQFKEAGQRTAATADGQLYVFRNNDRPAWPSLDKDWVPELPHTSAPCERPADQPAPCSESQRPLLRVIDNSTLRIGFYEPATPATPAPAPAGAPSPAAAQVNGKKSKITSTASNQPVTVHFVWGSPVVGTVDWPLKVSSPKINTTGAKATAEPALLYVGDSRTVKFSTTDPKITLGCFASASVEGIAVQQSATAPPATGDDASSHNSVSLQITRAITNHPGEIEITVGYYPLNALDSTKCDKTAKVKLTSFDITIVGTNSGHP
jgi:hypothetical protein